MTPLRAADYVTQVLRPAMDYARSKNLYAIIDYHQIDNAISGTSAADAKTFWTDMAAQFAATQNVLYEPFNEPIDTSASLVDVEADRAGLDRHHPRRAPSNIIIVPSNAWDQHPGDAASNPPTGTNLMYTAHIYPVNWSTAFQSQVARRGRERADVRHRMGIHHANQTGVPYTPSERGAGFQTTVNGDGASWIGVGDRQRVDAEHVQPTPRSRTLTDFGTLVKSWLASKASSDWVQ